MANGTVHCKDMQRYISVEYPGHVVNPERAIETIGGLSSLSRVCGSDQSRLELRYRPADVYCKPAYGTKYHVVSLLLRVKQIRHKKTGEMKFEVRVQGIIPTNYKFDTMADFQYLTLQKKDNSYESLLGKCTIESLETIDWLKKTTPVHLVPQMFSNVDVPFVFNFSDRIPTDKKCELLPGGALFSTVRKRKSNNDVTYEDKVPIACQPDAESIILTEYLRARLVELKQLFELRPIWSKAALVATSKMNIHRLKMLLPCVAFNSVSGPWRTMWIRFGYDPKEHVEAKNYQLVDYRYRYNAGVTHRRSYIQYLPSVKKGKSKSLRSEQLEFLNLSQAKEKQVEKSFDEKEEEYLKSTYMMWPGGIPAHSQMFYQICDIDLTEVQDIVNLNNGKEGKCDKSHGFLLPNSLDRIREIIHYHVERAISERAAADESTKSDDIFNNEQDEYNTQDTLSALTAVATSEGLSGDLTAMDTYR